MGLEFDSKGEMKMHRDRLSGVFAPITTPFNEQGDLLLEALSSNIQKLNPSRLRGYLSWGQMVNFAVYPTMNRWRFSRQSSQRPRPIKSSWQGPVQNPLRFPLNSVIKQQRLVPTTPA
jgi:hypothetical protein